MLKPSENTAALKNKGRWWIRIAVPVVIVAGLVLWTRPASSGPGITYRQAGIEKGDLTLTISATGTVEPEEVVDVGAQVAGMVKEFGVDPRDTSKPVDYGTPVEKGTVLARIDDAVYRSQLARAKAQVEQAKAAIEQGEAQIDQAEANVQKADADIEQLKAKLYQAERDFDRAQKLKARLADAISMADYDTADVGLRTARAALLVGRATLGQSKAAVRDSKANVAKLNATLLDARAGLENAEINLAYCTIQSPVKGIIVDRRVNVGQTVVASLNTPSLFLIAKDLKRVQVWASVNEADIGQVRKGAKVRFRVDAHPSREFQGEVAQVRLNAMMTQNVVTYTVVVTADNSAGLLLPYLTANVEIEIDQRKNVPLVPNAALRWTPEKDQISPDHRDATSASSAPSSNTGTVWIAEGSFVRPVRVSIGLTDGSRTEITGGDLANGGQVVVGIVESAAPSSASNPFIPKIPGKK